MHSDSIHGHWVQSRQKCRFQPKAGLGFAYINCSAASRYGLHEIIIHHIQALRSLLLPCKLVRLSGKIKVGLRVKNDACGECCFEKLQLSPHPHLTFTSPSSHSISQNLKSVSFNGNSPKLYRLCLLSLLSAIDDCLETWILGVR